jgi:hypothetical protein
MKLTDTLIDYLYRAFKKDPERFLAMRIRSENTLTWDVADGVLAVTTSLSSQAFTLENYTLATLASAVATMPGVQSNTHPIRSPRTHTARSPKSTTTPDWRGCRNAAART